MQSTRLFSYVLAVAATAGCSSPVALTPAGSPAAAPVATPTATTIAAPTATPVASTAPTATPTATAAPTATPTAAPTSSAAIVSNVNPLSFLSNPNVSACSSSLTVGFHVSENGYSGSFTAVSSNTSLVTITQNDGQDFTATEESTTGVSFSTSSTVTVTDADKNTLVIPVNYNKTCVP